MHLKMIETLKTLCDLPAVSGFEGKSAKAVAEMLKPYCDTVEIDGHGNILAIRKSAGDQAPTILLDAHLDQIAAWK